MSDPTTNGTVVQVEQPDAQALMDQIDERVLRDVRRADKAITAKGPIYTRLINYYTGDQPMPFLVDRLRDIFEGLDEQVDISENWCEVVVDAAYDRITLMGLQVDGDETLSRELGQDWTNLNISLEANEVHRYSLICGESYLIAWRGETGEGQLDGDGILDSSPALDDDQTECYYHDPRLCHVEYDSRRPNVKRFAAKMWFDELENIEYLTLYYPDQIYYFQREGGEKSKGEFFPYLEPADNPLGIIPVFHFRTRLRRAVSDLKNVTPIQDALNMQLINMIVAGEFAALSQKYIITDGEIKGRLESMPNTFLTLPAGSTTGEFAPANFQNFLSVIDHFVNAIAVSTRTPKHYFYLQGGDPSGEALQTMEGPHVKKCQERIDQFVPEWRQLGAFLLRLRDHEVAPGQIRPVFRDPSTVQPMTRATLRQTQAQTAVTLQSAGVSVEQTHRELGYTDEQIARMKKETKAGAQQPTANAEAATARPTGTAAPEVVASGRSPAPTSLGEGGTSNNLT